MVRILVLNLGSTSSKIAVFDDNIDVLSTTIVHEKDLTQLALIEQKPVRQEAILQWLNNNNITLESIDAIACRGGLLKPIIGGTYYVNEHVYHDLKSFNYGIHASNLSGIIGYELGQNHQVPVFTSDPVVVDELIDAVRYTGIPGVQRKSIFHALNHKATARRYAQDVNQSYDNLNLIVIHMGGGVSVAAHAQGNVIDVNEALYGEGPMALNRSGSIPNDELLAYQAEHAYSIDQMKRLFSAQSGLQAYVGSSDFKWIMEQYETDLQTRRVINAFAIQIAKAIGERAALLQGNVDQILFTGGMSYSASFIPLIKPYIEWIAPVSTYPGEFEMQALAENASRALQGDIPVNTYS